MELLSYANDFSADCRTPRACGISQGGFDGEPCFARRCAVTKMKGRCCRDSSHLLTVLLTYRILQTLYNGCNIREGEDAGAESGARDGARCCTGLAAREGRNGAERTDGGRAGGLLGAADLQLVRRHARTRARTVRPCARVGRGVQPRACGRRPQCVRGERVVASAPCAHGASFVPIPVPISAHGGDELRGSVRERGRRRRAARSWGICRPRRRARCTCT